MPLPSPHDNQWAVGIPAALHLHDVRKGATTRGLTLLVRLSACRSSLFTFETRARARSSPHLLTQRMRVRVGALACAFAHTHPSHVISRPPGFRSSRLIRFSRTQSIMTPRSSTRRGRRRARLRPRRGRSPCRGAPLSTLLARFRARNLTSRQPPPVRCGELRCACACAACELGKHRQVTGGGHHHPPRPSDTADEVVGRLALAAPRARAGCCARIAVDAVCRAGHEFPRPNSPQPNKPNNQHHTPNRPLDAAVRRSEDDRLDQRVDATRRRPAEQAHEAAAPRHALPRHPLVRLHAGRAARYAGRRARGARGARGGAVDRHRAAARRALLRPRARALRASRARQDRLGCLRGASRGRATGAASASAPTQACRAASLAARAGCRSRSWRAATHPRRSARRCTC